MKSLTAIGALVGEKLGSSRQILNLGESSMNNRLSPRSLASLIVSLAILAIPIVVAALTAAPTCPSCGLQ